MVQITLKGNAIQTVGTLPVVGSQVQDFKLVQNDLAEVSLENYAGKRKVLNIFPSIDTPVCSTSVRKFNQGIAALKNTVVLCISKDLPFAQKRFCGAEGIANVTCLSGYRSDFGTTFQVDITTGPLAGLYSRALVVLDENNKVLYSEQVPEIAQEPNYEAALKALA